MNTDVTSSCRCLEVTNWYIYMLTIFPRIDAAAFIYFVVQLGAATIRGRRLFESGIYYFRQYDRATYTASLANSWCEGMALTKFGQETTTHNGQDSACVVRGWSSALISRRFATKRYTRDEDDGEEDDLAGYGGG